MIFGGEDHKTGQAPDTNHCYDRLERTLLSMLSNVKVTHRWSGQVIETPDGLPYIGETAAHQFVGTGFSGNGMTFGTLTGMMAADRIAGRTNPWSDLFDPGRKKVRNALWDYVKENKDYPYYMIRDRFAGAEGAFASRRAARIGEDHRVESGQARRLPRRARRHHQALGQLHPHGLRGRMEQCGADVGLPVPRVAVQDRRGSDRGPGGVSVADGEIVGAELVNW